ncbi:MAG: thiolase family protein [Candidatus Endonucleobacter sp. (ex Gigantidas childressi)]|nr:thiolase family protein [Candidatus Endonucleobacter sp. (ex Gigantidas childressi)]
MFIESSFNIVVVSSSRTPIGAFQGSLSSLFASQLGAKAIAGCFKNVSFDLGDISEVLMGCVLPAGTGQAPARQAAIFGGIPDTTPCTTINKVCGSGMKAIMLGCTQLAQGEGDIVLAGGMESMTNAPYLVNKARQGLRLGHGQLQDHMFTDGLEDAYSGKLMGVFAQAAADRFDISRNAMDDYALESLSRAQKAISNGLFDKEIIPVETVTGVVDSDELPKKAKPEKIRLLKPAFNAQGTVTAANSSSISDGAAGVLMMREADATARGLKPVARICGYHSYGTKPSEFTLAPVAAITELMKKLNWKNTDVDLYEINEAFAVVALIAIRELGLDYSKVNVNGGACALGHPLGASGARIVVTLLHALLQKGGGKGIAALCIGGGEATALAVEVMA